MAAQSEALLDGVAAGGVAAVLSGAPSTLHAVIVGADPLEATLAAGTLLLPRESRPFPLLLAALPAHAALSLGWGVVLALVLPRRRTAAAGAVAGLAIAALDLGVVARRFPRIRALPVWPQLADHVAYGALVGAVVARRRAVRRLRAACSPTASRTPGWGSAADGLQEASTAMRRSCGSTR